MNKVIVFSFVVFTLCLSNVSAQCEFATKLFVSDPTSCAGYYLCLNGETLKGSCPDGYFFNEINQNCDYPVNVPCIPVPPTLHPITTTTEMVPTTTTTPPPPPSKCNGTNEYFVATTVSCSDYILCTASGQELSGKCPENFPYFSEENQYCTQDLSECTYAISTPPLISTETPVLTTTSSPIDITTPTTDPIGTTLIPTNTPTDPQVTQPPILKPPAGNGCTVPGDYFIASTTSCVEYFYCNVTGILSMALKCPDGFYFTQEKQACDYKELVPCLIP